MTCSIDRYSSSCCYSNPGHARSRTEVLFLRWLKHFSTVGPKSYIVVHWLKKTPKKHEELLSEDTEQEELASQIEQAPTSHTRSAQRYKWKAGEVTSAPFIPLSGSYKLLIDCETDPINFATILHYGSEPSCESVILWPSPSPALSSLHLLLLPSLPYCYNIAPSGYNPVIWPTFYIQYRCFN